MTPGWQHDGAVAVLLGDHQRMIAARIDEQPLADVINRQMIMLRRRLYLARGLLLRVFQIPQPD